MLEHAKIETDPIMAPMHPNLRDRLKNKKVLIWGARIVGIGFQRACKRDSINVVGFIDSDESLHNRCINGITVHEPKYIESLEGLQDYAIIVAVSIKEAEIFEQINETLAEAHKIDIIAYNEFTTNHYTIEIVGSCNLKCTSCAQSLPNSNVPKGLMTYETLEKVVKKLRLESPECSHVSLYSWGEPLIHPDIGKIIQLFHKNGIAVGLSTNLSHEQTTKLDTAIRHSPDYLKISLSGYYPKAYNNTHQGGDITLVKSNLFRLRYLIDKYKAHTMVDINYHLYRDNNNKNLNQMIELANELGFGISTVHALVMPLERVINYCEGNFDKQVDDLQHNLLVTIPEGIEASKSVKLGEKCPFRENQLNINADLSIPVCCTVFDRQYIVTQNYLDSSLDQIASGKNNLDICKKCQALALPQYNMGFNKQEWNKFANQKSTFDL